MTRHRDAHAGHGAGTNGRARDTSAEGQAEIRALQTRLHQLRQVQAALRPAFEASLEELRQQDAEAQRLMETDPERHTEMMRGPQRLGAMIREMPTQLLQHEAALYRTIEDLWDRIRQPGIQELHHGILMAWHVMAERWVHVTAMFLGAWLLFSPTALAYRSTALAWSDVISGSLVIIFAALTVWARQPWAPWANAVIGVWVAFAPLAFWAPTPVEYANDTLVGTLIVAFAVIIPMRTEMPGPEVPPEWTYNPSSWVQRAPVLVLGLLSFFLARYMASFQLGHIPAVWDPIFGEGTERVLTSEVSRAFPVSDAGLGAYTYILELLSTVMGDSRRWRTMPWMVAMFGVAVIPLGVVSTVLVMLQPIAVGAWCTICLITAFFMLLMVALSMDEVVAMIQYVIIGKRAGRSAWRLFWIGGTLPESLKDFGLARSPRRAWWDMIGGSGFTWTLLASGLVGAWIMAAPWVFGTTGAALNFETIFGALAIVVAFVAMAEVTRAARFVNIVIGLALIAAAWFLPDISLAARLSDMISGLLLIGLSLPRGPIHERYGGWNPLII